ncbi:TlpA family protein disulfide reductase [Chitinophaga agrisoli]|nr:redoxin domain-containing protein [Chitinophaga agrisoli]
MKRSILLSLLIFLVGCYARPTEKTGLEGKPMPDFDLWLADSSTYFNTGKISSGMPTVLFYFGPHCPYSKAQMEDILSNMKMFKDVNFYIFTTTVFPEMKEFYEHYSLGKYPNIVTGIDTAIFFPTYFKAQGVPYLAIYGKDKRLKEAFVGKVSAKHIKRVVDN